MMLKVAVFDLDGTLWRVNSHIDILNKRFRTRLFDSFFAKAFAKVFPKMFQKLIDLLYEKYVTEDNLRDFKPEFRDSAINILNEQKTKADKVMIISNAPEGILNTAKERLKIEGYTARIGKKHEVLLEMCLDIGELTVITDNVSDRELIAMAHRKIIYAKEKTKRIFCDMGFIDAEFMDYEEKE